MRLLLVTISVALVFSPVLGRPQDTKFFGTFEDYLAAHFGSAPVAAPIQAAPVALDTDDLALLFDLMMMFTEFNGLFNGLEMNFDQFDAAVDEAFDDFDTTVDQAGVMLDDLLIDLTEDFDDLGQLLLILSML